MATLVLLSCLMLFLELALIRLVAAHNVYVRYFTNFVLLASFLGIGLGFLRANSKRDSFSVIALLPAPHHRVRDALPRGAAERRHARRVRHGHRSPCGSPCR